MGDVVYQALIAACLALVLEWMRRSTNNAIRAASDSAQADAAAAAHKATEKVTTDAANVRTAARATAEVAAKTEEVKRTLEATDVKTAMRLDNMADVAAATHTLVNNKMAVQLQLNAVVMRRLAGLTNDAEDVRAASAAEDLYREHMAKQAAVDATKGG